MDLCLQYPYTVEHVAGKDNVAADVLLPDADAVSAPVCSPLPCGLHHFDACLFRGTQPDAISARAYLPYVSRQGFLLCGYPPVS